ncbi:MAG: hypothetical protein EOP04_09695, partial [Proteobacteria bacterium]
MAGFFSKLFGGKSKSNSNSSGGEVESLVNDTLTGIIEKGNFDLNFNISFTKESDQDSVLAIEFTGGDEEMLKDKKGQMLDAFQLFLKRVVQHNFPEDKTNITVDCGGFR